MRLCHRLWKPMGQRMRPTSVASAYWSERAIEDLYRLHAYLVKKEGLREKAPAKKRAWYKSATIRRAIQAAEG